MAIATVTILETNFDVEYEFDITTHGNGGTAPSMTYPGDPPEPAEFDIEVLSISLPSAVADVTLEMPIWLKDLITAHLYERADVNDVVQQADQDRASDHDYDYED